jgi:hypothetical protein
MADQKVNIDIRTKGARKAKDELGGLNGAMDKMGRAVGIASAAYFGTKGLINAFSSAIELAGIQEQAEKQLETALGGTSQALLNQASALQKVTTFGDEATIQQQAFLASLGFTEDKIIEIIPVAMDLATATGMTLESAVRNTAKTFSGLAGELGEMVPQLRDLTAEEMKAGDAVKIMADLFGGQATAQAETMAGALEQAQNASGDLAEAIGAKLSPLVKVLAADFTGSVSSLTELINMTMHTKSETLLYYETLEKGESVLAKYSESLGITTDESLSLSDQILQLREQARELNDSELAAGPWFSETARALRDTNGLVEKLESTLKRFRETALPEDRPFTIIDSHEPELLDDVIVDMEEMNNLMNESFGINDKVKKQKQDMVIKDLKNAALQQSSAKDAMKAVVRAETMEAVAGYIASVLKSVPFPANLVLAAGGGAIASGLIDRGLAAFADGGIVQGDPNTGDSVPAMLTPGEVILNASQQQGLLNNMGGVTVNIQGNMIGNEEFVRDTLIPEIDKTVNRGLA